MAEDPRPGIDEERLRRLMESPLTAPRKRRTDRPDPKDAPPVEAPDQPSPPDKSNRSWIPLLAALTIGGALALGGFLLADGGDAAPPPVAAAVPMTTTPVDPFGALPDGYFALNARVGARPERVLVRDDAMFVSFTTAVRSALEPDETAGFTAGVWTAVLEDGRRIPAIGEFTDPFARGTFTLGFPVEGYGVEDVAAVELSAEAIRSGATHSSVIRIEDGLPWSGVPARTRVPLEGDLTFVIDDMVLDGEGGRLEWHLEGGDDQEGTATASIQLTAEGTFPAGFLVERGAATFLGTFGSATPPPDLGRAGIIELVPVRLGRPSTVRTIDATWTIDWFSFVPASASIPLGGIPVVTVG